MNKREFLKLTALRATALAGPPFLSVCMAAAPESVAVKPFAHPGMLHSSEELEFVKQKVAAGTEPWKTAWERLRSSPSASLDYKPRHCRACAYAAAESPDISELPMSGWLLAPRSTLARGCLTGKEAHARKAIEILNAWSATLKEVSGHDTKLLIGMTGVTFCNAAELMRHTYTGWLKTDQKQFEHLLREVFFVPIKDFFPAAKPDILASMKARMTEYDESCRRSRDGADYEF